MRPFVLPKRAEFALLAAILFAVGFYAVGLLTGAVTSIGYQSATTSQSGAARSTPWSMNLSVPVPVWLGAQQAIRADFDVEARFGAVTLTVAPPLGLRTSLQAATAYVEGARQGSILFVPEASGWYTFHVDASPLGGPRCGTPGLSLKRIVIGEPACPSYDVTYRVHWHIADRQEAGQGLTRLGVPGPNGKLAVLRLRD